jgi:hypothetical protein
MVTTGNVLISLVFAGWLSNHIGTLHEFEIRPEE